MTEAKPYTVIYEERDSYLYAQVSGPKDSAEVSISYWKDVAAEARGRGLRRLLVTESFISSGSFAESYEVASQLPTILEGINVAFVDRSTDDYEDNRFAETVAINRGTRVKLFCDESAAIEWLVSLPPEKN